MVQIRQRISWKHALVLFVFTLLFFQLKLSTSVLPADKIQKPEWNTTIQSATPETITFGNKDSLQPPKSSQHVVLQFRNREIESLPPDSIPVVLWPLMDPALKGEKATSADMTHIEQNGVEESSVLRLANQSVRTLESNVVWVTDAKFPYKEWCTRLADKAKVNIERRQEAGISPVEWPIFVVDFTDTTEYEKCPPLEEVVGFHNVFYSKRSIVVNRTWDFNADWVNLGERLPETTLEGRRYQQTPLIVRTDIVEEIERLLKEDYNLNLSDELERMETRTVDVAHYWPEDRRRAVFSNMRNRVSALLVDHFAKDYQVFCNMTGTPDRVGRRFAQTSYVRHMLQTKIIVVAQRDTYEDHYRLYEGLASGAMIMTDPMLTLPEGLQNGTNVIVFSSLNEFVDLVKYYLEHEKERVAIAKAGRLIGLSLHRSWHRMESIILGRVATTCDTTPDSECPYKVHST